MSCYHTTKVTEMYPTTSALPTTEADIRFTGSTEYSARTFRIALVCKLNRQVCQHVLNLNPYGSVGDLQNI